MHLGSVNVRIALTDFRGNLIEYTKDKSLANKGPEVAMRRMMHLIDQMLQKAGLRYSDLSGLGIGISGMVERSTGVMLFWPKLPLWVNVPVRKMLEDRYKNLVELEDTSRTRAFAEYRLGGADSAKDFIYIAVGAGIGAALFLHGHLYSGAGGFAGEFGHITVSETGPPLLLRKSRLPGNYGFGLYPDPQSTARFVCRPEQCFDGDRARRSAEGLGGDAGRGG